MKKWFLDFWKKWKLWIFLLIPFVWICFHFGKNILEFLGNPNIFFVSISTKEIFIGIAGFITLALAIWKSWVNYSQAVSAQKTVENQTKTILNEEFTKKNQQFLDAIKLFENPVLEIKKGGLFHLENLALSSPEHRQRVLDFLNSLNQWMRDFSGDLKKIGIWDFDKWKTQKKPLLPEEIVSKNTQLLSAEIPKIFENIIKHHNKQWESFSKSEKEKYALDFSYFIFAEIDLSKEIFPQEETKFVGALFFGDIKFRESKFFGYIKFFDVRFLGEVTFAESLFFEKANFIKSKFLKKVDFLGGNFQKTVSFGNVEFREDAVFLLVIFSKNTVFWEAKFFKNIDFRKTQFIGEMEFSDSDFSKSSIQIPIIFEEEEKDFLSLENFEKFSAAGAIFSDEQKKYFAEKKLKTETP